MSKDTIVHGSIVTPSVKLVGACTVLDSVLRGDITVNPRAVLQGVEVDGRGTFYGRVCVLPADDKHQHLLAQGVHVGPGVHIAAGVRVLGHGEIRGEMTITRIAPDIIWRGSARGPHGDALQEGCNDDEGSYLDD